MTHYVNMHFMPAFRAEIKSVLPVLIALASLVWVLIFLRLHLQNAARQFEITFERQNYAELAVSDVFGLTTRINAMSGNIPWVCVHVRRGQHVFYARENGNCSRGIWREPILIRGEGLDPVEVSFTLTLQSELVWGAAIFAVLQLMVLLFLYGTTVKLEKERYAGAVKLGEFAAQVAHDIRSPLAALKSVSGAAAGLDSETKGLLDGITDRIQSIAEGLLTERRMGVAKEPAVKVSLDTSGLLAMVVDEKCVEFEHRKGVSITCDLSPTPLLIRAPRLAFLRVVSNLINNAVESLGNGGEVCVSSCQDGKWTQIEVKDTGRGISQALLKKINRGDVISHGKDQGNGLGLRYAFDQLAEWGGRVEIESEEGRGTRVRLRLPSA